MNFLENIFTANNNALEVSNNFISRKIIKKQ